MRLRRRHVFFGSRFQPRDLLWPMRLHLTLVHTEVTGDTFFPEWRHLAWRELDRRESADAHYRYTFYTLERP